ncbi:hypothetical protein BDR04DRAFT_948186, partial [Suillus decipiens]
TLCRIRKFTFPVRHILNISSWVPGWDSNVPMPAIIKPRPTTIKPGRHILSMVIPCGTNIHK